MKLLILSLFSLYTNGSVNLETSASTQQYATESSSVGRVDLSVEWKTEKWGQAHFWSWIEPGNKGDSSFDLDPFVFRFYSTENSHFWIGRTHPVMELAEAGNSAPFLKNTSAIGANWAQNQTDALSPRVSGWVGLGWSGALFNKVLTFSAAYSPIFIPTLGPRLSFSDSDRSTGSRFSHAPPAYVQINDNALLPLRYRLESGDLKNIVFQNQALAAVRASSVLGNLSAIAWAAPSVNPELDLSNSLHVNSMDAHVLVTIRPSFPRRFYSAIEWSQPDFFLKPDLQLVKEYPTQKTLLSFRLNPFPFLEAGLLHALKDTEPGDNAPYDRGLFWLEATYPIANTHLTPALRVEQHFLKTPRGGWIKPSLSYEPMKNLILFASVSLISGKDSSYFGPWRNLDSTDLGLKYIW